MKSKRNSKTSLNNLLERLERPRTLALHEYMREKLPLIEERYRELGNPSLRAASQDELIIVACRLGHLYSAFESLFRQVSQEFRRLSPSTRRPVLERMLMDLGPTRPAVIDEQAFEKLAALARFRHWFFQADRPLQEKDVAPVLRKALELRAIYRPQIEAFVEFLGAL
jgi:hypothetical protein